MARPKKETKESSPSAATKKVAQPVNDATMVDASGAGAGVDGAVSNGIITSVMKGPYVSPKFMYQSNAGYIESPFGPVYRTRRARPVADDTLMALCSDWLFDLTGYWAVGTVGAGNDNDNLPTNYTYGDDIMERWYRYFRRTLMSLTRHRAPVRAMTDPTVFKWFWNMYHDMVADTWAYLNVAKMRNMNEGFVALTTYLTESQIATFYSYWERLTAIRAPEFLKKQAMLDGTPFLDMFEKAVHVRFWRFDNQELDVGGGYTTSNSYYKWGGHSGTYVDDIITYMNNNLIVLEGICAAHQDDVDAMLELIEMSSHYDQTKGVFTQGLVEPTDENLPGYIESPDALNDIYCRALRVRDTHGLSGDEIVCFPVLGDAELGDQIPIVGYGQPGVNEWTLFGAPKFGCLDATDDLKSLAYDGNWIVFGTHLWVHSDFNPVSPLYFQPNIWGYTREDGWVEQDMAAYDLGDGASLAGLMNGIHPYPFAHAFGPMALAGQLDTDMEYRFMDKRQYDYQMYIPPADFCLNQASTIAQIFGVPSALS